MQDKTKKKRKEIKLQDLKPKKDAKGGVVLGGNHLSGNHLSGNHL